MYVIENSTKKLRLNYSKKGSCFVLIAILVSILFFLLMKHTIFLIECVKLERPEIGFYSSDKCTLTSKSILHSSHLAEVVLPKDWIEHESSFSLNSVVAFDVEAYRESLSSVNFSLTTYVSDIILRLLFNYRNDEYRTVYYYKHPLADKYRKNKKDESDSSNNNNPKIHQYAKTNIYSGTKADGKKHIKKSSSLSNVEGGYGSYAPVLIYNAGKDQSSALLLAQKLQSFFTKAQISPDASVFSYAFNDNFYQELWCLLVFCIMCGLLMFYKVNESIDMDANTTSFIITHTSLIGYILNFQSIPLDSYVSCVVQEGIERSNNSNRFTYRVRITLLPSVYNEGLGDFEGHSYTHLYVFLQCGDSVRNRFKAEDYANTIDTWVREYKQRDMHDKQLLRDSILAEVKEGLESKKRGRFDNKEISDGSGSDNDSGSGSDSEEVSNNVSECGEDNEYCKDSEYCKDKDYQDYGNSEDKGNYEGYKTSEDNEDYDGKGYTLNERITNIISTCTQENTSDITEIHSHSLSTSTSSSTPTSTPISISISSISTSTSTDMQTRGKDNNSPDTGISSHLLTTRVCASCNHTVEEMKSVFIPCNHMVSCDDCAAIAINCPVCHSTIKEVIKVFT